MLATLIELILNLLKAIPIFDRWFRKNLVEKERDAVEDLRKEIDEFKKTGRPPQ